MAWIPLILTLYTRTRLDQAVKSNSLSRCPQQQEIVSSVADLADISLKSPRKFISFMIRKQKIGLKYPKYIVLNFENKITDPVPLIIMHGVITSHFFRSEHNLADVSITSPCKTCNFTIKKKYIWRIKHQYQMSTFSSFANLVTGAPQSQHSGR